MSAIVVDASVVLGLLLPDESVSPGWAEPLATATLSSPSLLQFEVANALASAVRRQRRSTAEAHHAAGLVSRLGITLHPPPALLAIATAALDTGSPLTTPPTWNWPSASDARWPPRTRDWPRQPAPPASTSPTCKRQGALIAAAGAAIHGSTCRSGRRPVDLALIATNSGVGTVLCRDQRAPRRTICLHSTATTRLVVDVLGYRTCQEIALEYGGEAVVLNVTVAQPERSGYSPRRTGDAGASRGV